ncbi:hypothetical protein ASD12_22040 [Mesorhizobium sp. Root102]|nr:hypothetical protein ASD12_22040 [Mesorhizobium sp. Root102]
MESRQDTGDHLWLVQRGDQIPKHITPALGSLCALANIRIQALKLRDAAPAPESPCARLQWPVADILSRIGMSGQANLMTKIMATTISIRPSTSMGQQRAFVSRLLPFVLSGPVHGIAFSGSTVVHSPAKAR